MKEQLNGFLKELNVSEFLSCAKHLGIGFTPLVRLPRKINPYDKEVPVYVKKEYVNYGESQKARPFAMMHYYYAVTGKLEGKTTLAAATSSNYGLAVKYMIPEMKKWFTAMRREVPDLKAELYMSRGIENKNPDMYNKIIGDWIEIIGCSDEWCPTENSDRGQAIAYIRAIEDYFPNTKAYDQHGDMLNPLSYFLMLAPEIYYQTDGKVSHYAAGTGTCGSLFGGGLGLKDLDQNIKTIGLMPMKGHNQLGLRSANEIGASKIFKHARGLYEKIIEVSDEDAWSHMLKLWDAGIPSGITGGTYSFGAVKVAEEIYDNGNEGLITTLIPDSLENYGSFFRNYLYDIIGVEFDDVSETFSRLKTQAIQEREMHISSLRNSSSSLFETINNYWGGYNY